MEYEIRGHTVGIDTAECGRLAFGQSYDPQNQHQEEQDDNRCPDISLLLTDGAEDEVGMLLGDIFEFCLGAFQESLPGGAPRTDGDFGLVDVVAVATGVVDHPEGNLDSLLLMGHHMREHEIDREEEGD